MDLLNKQLDEELSRANIQQRMSIGIKILKLGDQQGNIFLNKNANSINNFISRNSEYQQMIPNINFQSNLPINFDIRESNNSRFKETYKRKKFSQGNYYQHYNNQAHFQKINALENHLKKTKIDFNYDNKNSPFCIRREWMLKIRYDDQKDKDVVMTYCSFKKR